MALKFNFEVVDTCSLNETTKIFVVREKITDMLFMYLENSDKLLEIRNPKTGLPLTYKDAKTL